jgi:hypothetical protein
MYFSINQYILKYWYILVPIWERGLIDVSCDPVDLMSLQKSDIPVNDGPWVRVYVFLENKSILKYLGSLCNPADNGMSNSFSTSVQCGYARACTA